MNKLLYTVLGFVSAFCVGMAASNVFAEEDDKPLVVVVVASGQGDTIDSAKEAALRQAIEDVVGSLLKSVSTSENGELVEDKVMSCSGAYVEKSAQMGSAIKDEDGIYTVKVKASVRRNQLVNDLEKYVAEIKGADLQEKIEQIKKNQAQFESFFLEEFDDALKTVVVAQPLAEEGCLPFEVDEDGNVSVRVEVGVDKDSYRVFSNAIVEKLRPFASEVTKVDGKKDSAYTWPKGDGNSLLVVKDFKTMAGTMMVFSRAQARALCNIFAKVNKFDSELTVRVSMMAEDGDEILVKKVAVRDGADSFPWRRVLLHGYKENAICAILPALNFGSARNYSYTRPKLGPIRVSVKLGKIDPEDLKRVNLVTITLDPPHK